MFDPPNLLYLPKHSFSASPTLIYIYIAKACYSVDCKKGYSSRKKRESFIQINMITSNYMRGVVRDLCCIRFSMAAVHGIFPLFCFAEKKWGGKEYAALTKHSGHCHETDYKNVIFFHSSVEGFYVLEDVDCRERPLSFAWNRVMSELMSLFFLFFEDVEGY